MGKVIAAINLTLDGIFDHDAITPSEDVHVHYAELINQSDILLYGRVTFGLMTFWKELIANPSGIESMDQFAKVMDQTPKIVFSRTLTSVDWHSATLAHENLSSVVTTLKTTTENAILVGSGSLIIQLMAMDLIDEYQFCFHPVIAVSGRRLFDSVDAYTHFKLINTKILKGGAVIHSFEKV